jgi:phosphatidate cytidylyltransferase
MSPTAALHDPVFREYLGLVGAIIIVAGVVLALLQLGFQIELGSVWKTWQSWVWMAPLAALFVFAGRIAFIAGVTALALIGFREFARGAGLGRDRWTCWAVRLGIFAVGVAVWAEQPPWSAAVFALILMALGPIVRDRKNVVSPSQSQTFAGAMPSHSGESELQALSLGVVGFVYLGWMFGELGILANSPNAYGYICFVLFATEACDVAAFAVGRIGGRHLLRPAISPRKTWEGSVGAFLLALALPWLLRFSFPHFGSVQLVLAGLIIGLGGQVGDLFSSLLKRELGLKDWGSAIPGHGGVLDRIDSLIFVAPLFILLANQYDSLK